jgi:hypothetical protein
VQPSGSKVLSNVAMDETMSGGGTMCRRSSERGRRRKLAPHNNPAEAHGKPDEESVSSVSSFRCHFPTAIVLIGIRSD